MMKRRVIMVITVLAAAWGVQTVWAPERAFAAGTYQVTACNDAPEDANHSWTWSTTDTSVPAHYAQHANCPYLLGGSGGTTDQEGGLSTTDALGLSSGAPPATSAAWIFTAAPGTTITGITYERYLGHVFDSSNYWSPALRADGTIVTGETCRDTIANSETCFVGGPPGHGEEPAVITGLSARELSFGIVCQAPSGSECVTGATQHEVWAAMYGSRVIVEDTTPPTLGTPSGSLWGAGQANGYHKGTETVTVGAEDIGGGVRDITLQADGHPIQTYTASCNYTTAQPCPLSTEPQTLTIPTTELSDGTHTLTLIAADAANNQSTTASEQITVDNNPPAPPIDLAANPTQPGGTTFTATWNDPSGQTAPITAATYQVCPASGALPCSAPTAAPPQGPATVTVPGPGSWTLAVWLTDAAGNNSAADAARTTLTVPLTSVGGSSSGGNSGGTTGGGLPGGASPQKTTIRVTERLNGHELIVHVSGPVDSRIRVTYTGRYHHRTIAHGSKTVTLTHGRLTVTFSLSHRAAANATIRVSAMLNQGMTARSTLRRHTSNGTKPNSRRDR